MKSKHLLLLLLFAMFAPWAVNAQNRTIITIGEGTGTNYYPMPGFYGYQYDVYLYTPDASEALNASNCTISSIAYDLTTINATSGAKMEIWLKDVVAEYVLDNAMTFSQYIDGATKVVDDDEFTTTETGWKTMSFTKDFVHEAGRALLVAVRGVGCSGTGGCSRYCHYTSASYMHWYKRADNSDPGQNATGTLDGNRSNIQLDITESAGVTCPKPANLTVSDITSSTAVVTWESEATSFYFEFKKSTEETWTPLQATNLFFTLAELDPNTTYNVRVKAICSVDPWDESAYATTQFTTACGTITSFPWMEGFEGYNADIVPGCWDNSTSTSSTLNTYPHYIWGVYGYNNNKMLRMYNYFVQSGTALINTMPIALPEEGEYQLAFDYSHRASCGAFKVKISSDGGTTFTDLQSYTSTGSSSYTDPGTFTSAGPISLAAYSGQTVILQFYADANYGSGAIFLDNLEIKELPCGVAPTITSVTPSSYNFWAVFEPGGAMQHSWMFYVTEPEGNPDDGSVIAGNTSDPEGFGPGGSPLEPNTDYLLWVSFECEADGTSLYSEPFAFTTPATCPAPTGLQVVEGSITSNGASFTWDAEEGATFQYYTIENPWEGFEPENVTWTDTPNNSIGWSNAFSPNTTQRFYLRKDCGNDDYSDYIYVEFRTACGPISLNSNYSENFDAESYTSVATSTSTPTGYPDVDLPYCWQFLNRSESTSTYPQAFLSSYSTYAVSGNCLFFKSSSTTPLYAILPEFEEDIADYQLTFTYRNEGTGNNNGTLYVGYMTDPSDANTFVQTLACERTTTLTTKTAYFANAPQGSFMAFKYEGGTNNNYYLGIDNVVVSMGPSCFPTGTLSYSNVQGHSVDLSWELVDANQNAWAVEYATTPEFYAPVTTVAAATNENFVLEGLEPLTPYYVRVHANCGDGVYSDYSNVVTFTTDVACPAPTGLHVVDLTAYRVTIGWDAEEGEMFQTYFPGGQPTYPFDPTTPPTNWNVQPQTENHSTWSNLTPETTYGIWLRRYCNDDEQSEPIYITFTTLDACPVPTNLAASNLTQNTADLSWEGSVDVPSYMVWYRRAEQVVGIDESFSTSSTPTGWEQKTGLLSEVMNGTATLSTDSQWSFGTSNGVFDSHARINIYGTGRKGWLITPSHIVAGSDIFTFNLALAKYNYSGTTPEAPQTTGTDDRFVVLITIDDGQTWTILREWNNTGSEYVYNDITCSATGEQVSLDLSGYVGCSVRIAFYGESTESNADNNLHIDNVKIGTYYALGADNFVQTTNTTVQLTDLDANTIYDVQVMSTCSNPAEWSEVFNFKTLGLNKKVFVGGAITDNDPEGNQWKNPYNWSPYGMPSATNDNPDKDVILRHDAVISGQNTVVFAFANSITFEGTPLPTLTIEDGNELLLNTNIDVQNQVTVKKNITGYTSGQKDHYYLISIPAQNAGRINPVNSGLVTTESDYDLYKWSYNATDGLEWRNYKQETFLLDQAEGYLYANAADVELHFTGKIRQNKTSYSIFNYNYTASNEYDFNGWELCGNPLTCNAYLANESGTMAFYRMNAEGTDFEVATGAIKPMEGFFSITASAGDEMTLSRTAPTKGMSRLNLVLSQGRDKKDNAIIRFDEGNTLEKFSFRENSSKVYMPMEGKDYAVANAESNMGEMPVSFKAEHNGTYTLNFNAEDVTFAYLHLIDNMTGIETDLLETPSYSFEAKTTDYASRFKLVFVCGDANVDNDFAFYSNGNFVINNEGNATLQVVDVMGRILKSESINGCVNVNVNAAPGVYMLRLVNGDNVKVQKVVVR